MGTWGAGNFDSDAAAEYLDELLRQMISIIESYAGSEPEQPCDFEDLEEKLMPSVDIMTTLIQHYRHASAVELPQIQAWRRNVLAIYDQTIDDVGPKERFKTQRRIVIQNTFDKLEVLVHEQDVYVRKLRGEG